MTWKTFDNRFAITLRRRGLATAVVYGLSLSVRFTSAAGEEVEIAVPPVQNTRSQTSIISGRAQLPYQDWGRGSAQPVVFRHREPLNSLMSALTRPGCPAP